MPLAVPACAMERSMPMAGSKSRSFLLLCCLAVVAGVLQARAQPDSKGFISIDCGLPGTASYVENATKISYAPDAGFTDTGTNHNVWVEYISDPKLSKSYYNVRSFPNGARGCYTLRSLVPGLKYLVSATFMYGNYDGLNRLPIFDLHVGANFWTVVNISGPATAIAKEAIVVVPDDFLHVCLVNTGAGTPFISGLDLRPLKKTLYPQANDAQGLVLRARVNFGPMDQNAVIRYPDDPHDRLWTPWPWVVDVKNWAVISTTERVQNIYDDLFDAPSAVMRTAITPRNATNNMEFYWDPEPQPNDPSPGYVAIMYFSELQLLPSNAVREFYIDFNVDLWFLFLEPFTPTYLYTNSIYSKFPSRQTRFIISLNATSNSTLPPIINALEIFSVISTANVGTDAHGVSAMEVIKAKYEVKKNWVGDPCIPMTMAWDGLLCSYPNGSHSSIISVNMSSYGLNGDISSYFTHLDAIQYLDLSNNNLRGLIPDELSQLTSLAVLDLSGNQLSGSIPSGLLKRVQDGSLKLRYGNNPNLCTNDNSCQPPAKTNSKLAIFIAVPVALIAVVVSVTVLLCCFLRRRKTHGSMDSSVKPQNETPASFAPSASDGAYGGSSVQLDQNRRFTYKELEAITNSFQRVLGRGGFGYVYDGFLEDGTQVAVKLRSNSSNQGAKEFLAEAQILTRIHHKNLVSMIGYCKDGEYMALVYEYMPEGTLQEHIAGTGQNGGFLNWRQRLRIALESAQGLEYLHRGCNPPLIHRDVKATNILLNARLEAKLADFGLSKAFEGADDTHVSTNTLVGTLGYVDPEYHATMQPTTKSDVYSFGVVLLELVTGKPPILRASDQLAVGVIQWVKQQLTRGNIEDVVDPRMRGDHDVNSVWKVAEVALKCTERASAQRPTMADVVAQLQECLDLEAHRSGGKASDDLYNGGSNTGGGDYGYDAYTTDQSTDVSQNSAAFEMEHHFKRTPTMSNGPAAR